MTGEITNVTTTNDFSKHYSWFQYAQDIKNGKLVPVDYDGTPLTIAEALWRSRWRPFLLQNPVSYEIEQYVFRTFPGVHGENKFRWVGPTLKPWTKNLQLIADRYNRILLRFIESITEKPFDPSELPSEDVGSVTSKEFATMNVVYATHDHDGEGNINENADIQKFSSREKAEQYLRRTFDLEAGDEVKIIEGGYKDCWIKTINKPKVGDFVLAPFSYTQVIIQRPGSHPGGNMYWLTPSPDVLVAVLIPGATRLGEDEA